MGTKANSDPILGNPPHQAALWALGLHGTHLHPRCQPCARPPPPPTVRAAWDLHG